MHMEIVKPPDPVRAVVNFNGRHVATAWRVAQTVQPQRFEGVGVADLKGRLPA